MDSESITNSMMENTVFSIPPSNHMIPVGSVGIVLDRTIKELISNIPTRPWYVWVYKILNSDGKEIYWVREEFVIELTKTNFKKELLTT